jgi:hypothetical protein
VANEFHLPEGAESVRCSSLPTWPDCERRWMATQRKGLLAAAGFRLRERASSVGLYVGRASHAGLAHGWSGFQNGDGWWTPQEECDELAMVTLQVDTDGGRAVSFDRTSPDLNAAEQATLKIMRAYRLDVPVNRRPVLIEHAMAARIDISTYLTGHCDLFTEPDLALEDYKTGVRVPDPQQQLGGYVLDLRAHRRTVAKARMTWMRRVGKRTEQPPPMTVAYDPALAAKLARQTLGEIKEKLGRFRQGPQADPFVFRANTASVLCGAKYCPAYNTDFCPESKAKAAFTAKDDDDV